MNEQAALASTASVSKAARTSLCETAVQLALSGTDPGRAVTGEKEEERGMTERKELLYAITAQTPSNLSARSCCSGSHYRWQIHVQRARGWDRGPASQRPLNLTGG